MRTVGPAKKRFGQHFLEPAWVEKVVRAIAPRPDETFLEIGPGRGALTRPLAARVKRLVAFELDRDLAADLRAAGIPNLTVIEGDFLDITVDRLRAALIHNTLSTTEDTEDTEGKSRLEQVLTSVSSVVKRDGTAMAGDDTPRPLRVAGNLPYNVASPILFTLTDLIAAGVPLTDATVMLQREVADRLVARPGTSEYGVLTVLIGHIASIARVFDLPPGAFRPPPKVRSTLLTLRFHPPEPAARDAGTFAALVRAAFTRRRKTLANALRAFPLAERLGPAEALRAAGLDGGRRPETLTIAEWVRLADVFAAHRGTA